MEQYEYQVFVDRGEKLYADRVTDQEFISRSKQQVLLRQLELLREYALG